MRGQLWRLHRGLIPSWNCIQHKSWEISSLNRRFGDSLFSCGMNPNNGNEPVLVKLSNFLQCHVSNKSIESISKSDLFNLPYIFDPAFEVDCPDILDDYNIPSIFDNIDKIRTLETRFKPDYRWFLLGGIGSGSPLHVDPCFTSAWNAVVCGRKLWIVIDPEISNHVANFEVSLMQKFITNSVYNNLFTKNATSNFSSPSICRSIPQTIHDEITESIIPEMIRSSKIVKDFDVYNMIYVFFQEKGEVLYVPSNWYHAAINLMPTVAVTHNFVEHANKEKFLSAYKSEVKAKFSDQEWNFIENVVMTN